MWLGAPWAFDPGLGTARPWPGEGVSVSALATPLVEDSGSQMGLVPAKTKIV